jgi:hypothetical protein
MVQTFQEKSVKSAEFASFSSCNEIAWDSAHPAENSHLSTYYNWLSTWHLVRNRFINSITNQWPDLAKVGFLMCTILRNFILIWLHKFWCNPGYTYAIQVKWASSSSPTCHNLPLWTGNFIAFFYWHQIEGWTKF